MTARAIASRPPGQPTQKIIDDARDVERDLAWLRQIIEVRLDLHAGAAARQGVR